MEEKERDDGGEGKRINVEEGEVANVEEEKRDDGVEWMEADGEEEKIAIVGVAKGA